MIESGFDPSRHTVRETRFLDYVRSQFRDVENLGCIYNTETKMYFVGLWLNKHEGVFKILLSYEDPDELSRESMDCLRANLNKDVFHKKMKQWLLEKKQEARAKAEALTALGRTHVDIMTEARKGCGILDREVEARRAFERQWAKAGE